MCACSVEELCRKASRVSFLVRCVDNTARSIVSGVKWVAVRYQVRSGGGGTVSSEGEG